MFKNEDAKNGIIIFQSILCTILVLLIAVRESPRRSVEIAVDLDLPQIDDKFSHPIRLTDMNPMVDALQVMSDHDSTLHWNDINSRLNTVVQSDDYCTRRDALTQAAGLFIGADITEVNSPEYTAEHIDVKMGSDSGAHVFVPSKITLCTGDSIVWINNLDEPQKVAFDVDPCVGQEPSPMLNEKGDSFTMKFTTSGIYQFYSIPYRNDGMTGVLFVE